MKSASNLVSADVAGAGAMDVAAISPRQADRSAASGVRTSSVSRAVPPKLVCILGVGRTGTNHLATVLSKVPGIDSRRELFNPDRIWMMHPHELAEIARRVGKPLPCSPEDRQTINAIRRQPGLALDCLVDLMAPERRVLVFKVFRDQLSVRQVKKAIISRPDTAIVFIRRRPIDTYVSHRKAGRINKWVKVDTTQMKVEIDPRKYLRWWRQTTAWYRGLEAACWSMGKPFHEMTYEEDIAASPVTGARRFCDILEECGLEPFALPEDDPELGLTRQDRTDDVRARMANWPEFERHLSARRSLDKAFEAIPHFQPSRLDRLRRSLLS
ncbi:MAG: sulfotransferase [Dongiaceae bacterium]